MELLPNNHEITITLTAAEVRGVINAANLTGLDPAIDPAPMGVLRMMMALQNAETLGGRS